MVSSVHVFAAVFLRMPDVLAIAAIASRSASHDWTLVPMARPRVVRAVAALASSSKARPKADAWLSSSLASREV